MLFSFFRGQGLHGGGFASAITHRLKVSTVCEWDSREMFAEVETDFKTFRENYELSANV